MRTRFLVIPILTLAVILSGCGSTKKTVSTTSTTSTTAPTTTTTNLAADKASAQKMVLVKADVPAGWTDTPPTPDDVTDNQLDDQLNACIGSGPDAQTEETKAVGDEFSQGNNTIDSEADVEKSAQQPQQDLAGITNSKNYPCIENVLETSFKQSLGAQASAATITSSISPIPGLTTSGNEFALRITLTVKTAAQILPVYIDLFGITTGRYEVNSTATYTGSVAPVSLEKSLLTALESHVKSATTA